MSGEAFPIVWGSFRRLRTFSGISDAESVQMLWFTETIHGKQQVVVSLTVSSQLLLFFILCGGDQHPHVDDYCRHKESSVSSAALSYCALHLFDSLFITEPGAQAPVPGAKGSTKRKLAIIYCTLTI